MLKSYRVSKVSGDRYAGEWTREGLRNYDIGYDLAEKPKSDLYRDLLPLINARRVDLLDDRRLQSQLVGLGRRTARSGKDSIDHGPGGHDDIANAVAGCAGLLAVASGLEYGDWVDGPEAGDEPVTYARLPYFSRLGGLPWLR